MHYGNILAGVFSHKFAEMLDNPEIVFIHAVLLWRAQIVAFDYYTSVGKATSIYDGASCLAAGTKVMQCAIAVKSCVILWQCPGYQ